MGKSRVRPSARRGSVTSVPLRKDGPNMNKRDTEQLGQRAIEMLLNDAQEGLRDSVAGRVLSEEEFQTRLTRRSRVTRMKGRRVVRVATGVIFLLLAIVCWHPRSRE